MRPQKYISRHMMVGDKRMGSIYTWIMSKMILGSAGDYNSILSQHLYLRPIRCLPVCCLTRSRNTNANMKSATDQIKLPRSCHSVGETTYQVNRLHPSKAPAAVTSPPPQNVRPSRRQPTSFCDLTADSYSQCAPRPAEAAL